MLYGFADVIFFFKKENRLWDFKKSLNPESQSKTCNKNRQSASGLPVQQPSSAYELRF